MTVVSQYTYVMVTHFESIFIYIGGDGEGGWSKQSGRVAFLPFEKTQIAISSWLPGSKLFVGVMGDVGSILKRQKR